MSKKFYRINHYIQAREVRVVDEKGKQIGVMPISQALKQAQEKGVDLVEVAPKAQPPVCKIIDFRKFKYLESKREQEEKKKAKKVEIKEIHLTPFIAANDFNFRMERAEKFLKDGDKVKIAVRFRGRERDKKDFGYRLIEQALEKLKTSSEIDLGPKFMGNRLELVLRPKGDKDGKKDENKKINRQKI